MQKENLHGYTQLQMKEIKEPIKKVEKGIQFSTPQRLEKEMASVLFGTMVSATLRIDVNSCMRNLHPAISKKSAEES